MTLITRLLAVGAILSAIGVNAVSVSSPPDADFVARHRRHAAARSDDYDGELEHHHPIYIPEDLDEDTDASEPEEELVQRSHNVTSRLVARGNGKVGLAWAGNKDSNLHGFVSGQTKYIYTWSPYCPATALKLGLQCCPMLWGNKQISAFEQNKYKGSKCVMGMNEVNVKSQGYLSVSDGIKLWNTYVRPLKAQGYLTVSPSVTAGPDGVTWLQQFYKNCGGNNHCGADVIAFHYYGMDPNDFIQYAQKFHAITGGTVWVTEIACQNFGDPKKGQCTQDMVYSFMDKTTAWMKSTSWIGMYAFFGAFVDMYNVNPKNCMVDKNGVINALGHHYIGA